MRLCVIGKRGHVFYIFQSIAQVPGLELAGISMGCGDAPEGLLEICSRAGFAPPVFEDWRRMLDETRPDLLAIDGPWELHATMAAHALRMGIHVFCEKPVSLTLEGLREVEEAQRATGAHLLSMVGLRYEAAFQFALEQVRAGAVGKVKLVRAQKSYKLGTRPAFYHDRDTYGGTIPWVGSHALDWILAFSGAHFQTIYATQTREDNRGNGDLEVACQVLCTMSDDVQAMASIDYLRPDAAPSHGDDRVRVAGTEGVLEVLGGKVTLIDAQGERNLAVPPPRRAIFSDFAASVAAGTPLWVPEAETFELTRACLLARESADTGVIARLQPEASPP